MEEHKPKMPVPTTTTALPSDAASQGDHIPPQTIQQTQTTLWAEAKCTITTPPPFHIRVQSEWEVLTLNGHDRNIAREGDWICLVDAHTHIPFPNATHTALTELNSVIPHSEGSLKGPGWRSFLATDHVENRAIIVHIPITYVDLADIQANMQASITWFDNTIDKTEEAFNDLISRLLNPLGETRVHVEEQEVYDIWGFLDIDLLEM
ncbi:hypothetical protein H0H92_005422 [Tricholoma furcatifolium]|nr:hypothetical protein H0H92_005422 [Tricholoma furcatifolium]